MQSYLERIALAGLLLGSFAAKSTAQTEKWRVDAAHSHAAFFLVSSKSPEDPRLAGMARASGLSNLKAGDPSRFALRLCIYPEDQGEFLLSSDDTFRADGLAQLARYAILNFVSVRAVIDEKEKLKIVGELTVTHVSREAPAAWSNSYKGARTTEAVKRATTREITFQLQNSPQEMDEGEQIGWLSLQFSADIDREDFPELWTDLEDAIWPVVVDDRDCVMPPIQPSMRDYRGASCTGNNVNPPDWHDASEKPQKAVNQTTGEKRPSDRVSIILQIKLKHA